MLGTVYSQEMYDADNGVEDANVQKTKRRRKRNKGTVEGKKKREVVVPDVDVIESIQENIMFADDLTETLLVQMIHTMGENGVDISSKSFIKDISFVVEGSKVQFIETCNCFIP